MRKTKTLIIYDTQYGFKEKYAKVFSEEFKADICDSKNMSVDFFKNYNTFILGRSSFLSSVKSGKFCEQRMELYQNLKQIKEKEMSIFFTWRDINEKVTIWLEAITTKKRM